MATKFRDTKFITLILLIHKILYNILKRGNMPTSSITHKSETEHTNE